MYISNSKKEQSIKKLKKQTTRKQSIKKLKEQTTMKQRIKQSMTSFLTPKQKKQSNKTEIESTIDSIISNITKQDISADAKIQMICEKLSHLETIDFHGVLIIPYSNSIVSKKDVTRGQTLGGTRPTLNLEHYTRELQNELSKTYKDVRRISRLKKRIEDYPRQQLEEEMKQITLCEETYGKIKDYDETTTTLIKEYKEFKFMSLQPIDTQTMYKEFRQNMPTYNILDQKIESIKRVINTAKVGLRNVIEPGETTAEIKKNALTANIIKNHLSLTDLFDISPADCVGITHLVGDNSISVKNAKEMLGIWEKNVSKLIIQQQEMFLKGYNPVPRPINNITEYNKFISIINAKNLHAKMTEYFKEKIIRGLKVSVQYSFCASKGSIDDQFHCYEFYSKSTKVAETFRPSKLDSNLHFTIHLGSFNKDFDLTFDRGKTHMKGKADDFTHQANMAPHIYKREPNDDGFQVGPEEFIQVIPIYPGNCLSNHAVLYIGECIHTILNEYLDNIQDGGTKHTESMVTKNNVIKAQLKIKTKNDKRTELIDLNTRLEEIQKTIANPDLNGGKNCPRYSEILSEISEKITTFLKDNDAPTGLQTKYIEFLDSIINKTLLPTPETGRGKYKRKKFTRKRAK